MDGSHPDTQPVPNRHVISLDWFRTELEAALALDDAWEVGLYVPYDVKDQDVRFEDPGGGSISNPQGEIHHRDERLEGFGDLELTGSYRLDRLRLTLGTTVPTGKIEEDPYELGAQGIRHRHIQFGTGTLDPIIRVSTTFPVDVLEFDAAAGLRAPLYENREGYRGATAIDLSVGPRVEVADGLSVSLQYYAQYQTRAYWDGDPDENSGYFLQALRLSTPIELAERLVVRPSVLYVMDVNVRSGADNFEMDWFAGLSLEYSFDRPAVAGPGSATAPGP